jgi:glycosyltransferase involved in cell wall biosynthesis
MTPDGRSRVCVWREDLLPGSETFVLNQARALRRWAAVLTGVRTCSSALAVIPDFTIQGNSALSHRLDRRLYWNLGTSVRLHRHLRSTTLVHAHFGPDATHIARAACLAGRPLLATFHGYDVTTPPQSLGVDYSRLFERASRLLAVSNFIRGKLVRAGAPEAKITVAPIGVPLKPDSPRESTGEHLLFVGRLIPQKGCADLLAAVSGLSDPPPILIVGDGPHRPELERLAARLRVNATFVGARDSQYVSHAMTRSIALCVPSRAEGLGMVFLEAAAAGIPAVSYDSGGIPEAVVHGETGLLAPEGDVEALARHLQTVTNDPNLADRLGAAARRRVEQEFDIVKRTAALEDLYDEVTAQKREGVRSRSGGARRYERAGTPT